MHNDSPGIGPKPAGDCLPSAAKETDVQSLR